MAHDPLRIRLPKHEGNPFPQTPLGSIPAHDEIKKAGISADLLLFHGGAEGDRTPDPKTASLVLSQLSYSPMFFLQLRGVM